MSTQVKQKKHEDVVNFINKNFSSHDSKFLIKHINELKRKSKSSHKKNVDDFLNYINAIDAIVKKYEQQKLAEELLKKASNDDQLIYLAQQEILGAARDAKINLKGRKLFFIEKRPIEVLKIPIIIFGKPIIGLEKRFIY